MAYEQKEMSGSLFKNDKREKDTHPNATGSCLIDGVDYWISAWTKKDKNGNPWQSLAFKKKDGAQTQASIAKAKAPADEMDDDIPF